MAEISGNGQPVARNVMWFEKTKDLDLPRPEVTLSVTSAPNGAFAIAVGTKQLARDVYLGSGAIDATDLRAGRPARSASSKTTSSTCFRARAGP